MRVRAARRTSEFILFTQSRVCGLGIEQLCLCYLYSTDGVFQHAFVGLRAAVTEEAGFAMGCVCHMYSRARFIRFVVLGLGWRYSSSSFSHGSYYLLKLDQRMVPPPSSGI